MESGDVCLAELDRGRCLVIFGSCNARFLQFRSCGPTATNPPNPPFGLLRPHHRLVAKSSMARPKAAPTIRPCITHRSRKAAHICRKHVCLWCRRPHRPPSRRQRRKMCYICADRAHRMFCWGGGAHHAVRPPGQCVCRAHLDNACSECDSECALRMEGRQGAASAL